MTEISNVRKERDQLLQQCQEMELRMFKAKKTLQGLSEHLQDMKLKKVILIEDARIVNQTAGSPGVQGTPQSSRRPANQQFLTKPFDPE